MVQILCILAFIVMWIDTPHPTQVAWLHSTNNSLARPFRLNCRDDKTPTDAKPLQYFLRNETLRVGTGINAIINFLARPPFHHRPSRARSHCGQRTWEISYSTRFIHIFFESFSPRWCVKENSSFLENFFNSNILLDVSIIASLSANAIFVVPFIWMK